MVSDVITIKIKIHNNNLEPDEKNDLIIANLEALVEYLEENKGNVLQVKGSEKDSSINYVHLIHK